MTSFGDIEFERRVFPRFILHLPFSYQIDQAVVDSGQQPVDTKDASVIQEGEGELKSIGLTENASQGGLLLYLPEQLPVGSRIKIMIALAEQGKVRNIEAKVRIKWIESTGMEAPRLYKAGVAFEAIEEDAETFLKWFEQLWLEQSS